MGSDDLFKKRKNETLSRRKNVQRQMSSSMLIVCEGTKTEVNYFKSFPTAGVVTEVIGTGTNTISFIDKAMKLWNKFRKEGKLFEKLWCVFDRDDFPQDKYNEAFNKIDSLKNEINKKFNKELTSPFSIEIAYSNQSFELWYLLHFEYRNSAMHRSDYENCLTKHIGQKYIKNSVKMYDLLNAITNGKGQANAIKYARKLREDLPKSERHNHNPSTTVDLLVEVLNTYLKK